MVEIYCDAATVADIERYADDDRIRGFTTNPSLMKKAGITNYRAFAKLVLGKVKGKPVSFEVLADDFYNMESQAREISEWGGNVWVKIPVTNTLGESSIQTICALSKMQLNVTAVMTQNQIWDLMDVLTEKHILSIFVGRITDTGRLTPIPKSNRHGRPRGCKVLWASTRTVNSIDAAEAMTYDIITMTPDLIAKLPLRGKDLSEYSLETVKQFHEDGKGIEF